MTVRPSFWFAPVSISLVVNLLFLWVIHLLIYIEPPGQKADFIPIQLLPVDATPAPEIVKLEPTKPKPDVPTPPPPPVRKSAPPPIPAFKEESQPLPPPPVAPQIEELGLDQTHQVEPEPSQTTSYSAGPSPVVSGSGQGDGVGDGESTAGGAEFGVPFAPLSRLTKIPAFINRKEPVYPEKARITGKSSSVIAEVDLDEKGSIIEIRIIKSGGKDFDSAVVSAIKASSFTPGYIKDRPVPVRVQIPYVFKLR